MVTHILDSNIVIDILRGYQPAVDWLSTQGILGITRFVYLELLDGVENNFDKNRVHRLLSNFELVPVEVVDVEWAQQRLNELKLSHSPDAFDCLIAATCHRLQLSLYTRNSKHMLPLLGSLVVQPYP